LYPAAPEAYTFAVVGARSLLWVRLALVLGLSLGLGACGAGGSAASEAKTPKSAGKGDEHDAPSEGSEREAAVDPRKAACADGTCFECGPGLCPKGFYCDQKAPGGAACAWLPECAQSPSCGCIERVLQGCACEERGGGIFVNCQ
jgi:hypothetical protein